MPYHYPAAIGDARDEVPWAQATNELAGVAAKLCHREDEQQQVNDAPDAEGEAGGYKKVGVEGRNLPGSASKQGEGIGQHVQAYHKNKAGQVQ